MQIIYKNSGIVIRPETRFPRWTDVYASLLKSYVNPHCPTWFSQAMDSEPFTEGLVRHIQANALTGKTLLLTPSSSLSPLRDTILSAPARIIDHIKRYIDVISDTEEDSNHL